MKYSIAFLAIILISQNIFAQNKNMRSGQSGKCYAKAHADSKVNYDFYKETYPIFIGEKNENIEIENKTIMVSLPSSTWKKCKDIKTGIGTNSSVWCLVEAPGETIEIQVVVDISTTKNYVMETFETYENVTLEIPENSSVWVEVICENNLTKNLISEIQEALHEKGFYKKNEITN